MNRFEDRVHTERRAAGELSADALRRRLAGDPGATCWATRSSLADDYGAWWSYVPHFVDTPGYVYAYAYGHLLALSVYRRYQEQGEGFAPEYVEMLRAGGSRSPEDLGKIVGVDLTDPGFWQSGLDLIAEQLDRAEQAATEAGRL